MKVLDPFRNADTKDLTIYRPVHTLTGSVSKIYFMLLIFEKNTIINKLSVAKLMHTDITIEI